MVKYVVKRVVKLKNCQIGIQIGVVVYVDPVIMIVMIKRQKGKKTKRQKDKKTKRQKDKKTKDKRAKRQKCKKTKRQKDIKTKRHKGKNTKILIDKKTKRQKISNYFVLSGVLPKPPPQFLLLLGFLLFVIFIVHINFTPLVCGAQGAPQGGIVAYMALSVQYKIKIKQKNHWFEDCGGPSLVLHFRLWKKSRSTGPLLFSGLDE